MQAKVETYPRSGGCTESPRKETTVRKGKKSQKRSKKRARSRSKGQERQDAQKPLVVPGNGPAASGEELPWYKKPWVSDVIALGVKIALKVYKDFM